MSPEDLLNMAEGWATGAVSHRRGRPRRADLNRAVSSIYYALFHALAACGADLLVGRTKGSRSETAWRQAYRALEHGRLRRQCSHTGNIAEFPYGIRKLAFLIVQMQRARHLADYDPSASFSRSHVLKWVGVCRGDTIADFDRVGIQERRAFTVYVLLPMRKQ